MTESKPVVHLVWDENRFALGHQGLRDHRDLVISGVEIPIRKQVQVMITLRLDRVIRSGGGE